MYYDLIILKQVKPKTSDINEKLLGCLWDVTSKTNASCVQVLNRHMEAIKGKKYFTHLSLLFGSVPKSVTIQLLCLESIQNFQPRWNTNAAHKEHSKK